MPAPAANLTSPSPSAADGVMLTDPKRGPITHPALVESRQQRLVLARILTALRVPDADGVQPQRRGLRGFYGGDRGTA